MEVALSPETSTGLRSHLGPAETVLIMHIIPRGGGILATECQAGSSPGPSQHQTRYVLTKHKMQEVQSEKYLYFPGMSLGFGIKLLTLEITHLSYIKIFWREMN